MSAALSEPVTHPLPPVAIRPVEAAAVPLIESSWKRSYRRHLAEVSTSVYYDEMNRLVPALLARSTVLVACDPADPDQVYGYAVVEVDTRHAPPRAIVHYVYVKSPFRRLGVGMRLIECALISSPTARCCSHITSTVTPWASLRGIDYNPFAAVCRYQ